MSDDLGGNSMKRFIGTLFAALMLGGCFPPLPTIRVPHGLVFLPTIGVNIYQGTKDIGPLVGTVHAGTGSWFYVPAGFQTLTGEYTNGRGGSDTISLSTTPEHPSFFVITQKPGVNTPDVVITQVPMMTGITAPPVKTGMAAVYIFYDDNGVPLTNEHNKNMMQKLE